MKNKKIVLCLSSLLVISLMLTGCGKAKVKNGEEVAVSTKGNKITATEYYDSIKTNEIAELIDMIDKGLLEKEYKSDDEEKEAIENQITQLKSNFNNDEEQYKSALKQYFGVESEKELKEMLKLEYKRNKAIKDYISKNLTKKEINDYYDENVVGQIKASHILITADVKDDATDEEKEKAEEAAYKKAQKIIKSLDDGKDFAELAKKNSKDEASAVNGGDLGFFDPSDMVEEFANAVKELKDGEYTKEPVKTKYGYHIILRVEQKDKDKLEDVEDDIKEKLTTKKLEDDSTLYYKTLMEYRESKKLKWNDSKLKKAYNDYMNNLITNSTSTN